MVFQIGNVTRVSLGGNHFNLPITINSRVFTLTMSLSELKDDPDNVDEAIQWITNRIRSAVQEYVIANNIANPTLADLRAAIQNKGFCV